MKVVIVCIGNSHTAGFPAHDPMYGGNPESTYIYWLDRKLCERNTAVEFINHGVCGQTSAQINARIPGILKQIKPTHVILISGANDIGWGISNNAIAGNIRKSIITLKESDCTPILCSIPPMSVPVTFTETHLADTVEDLNNKLAELATQQTIPFADIWKKLVDEVSRGLHSDYDAGDGVHLQVDGYFAVAESIFPVLLQCLTG